MLRNIILFLVACTTSYTLVASELSVGSKGFYITDGDSVSVKMRIYGIDTPELGQQCQHQGEILDCGKIAKEHLRTLIKEGRNWQISVIATDDYGRLLVRIQHSKGNLAEQMVADGMAYAYGKKYKALEQESKRLQKGFWAYDTPPISPRIWRRKYLKR